MFETAVEDGDLRANPFANLRINVRHENESVSEEEDAKAMTRAQLARFLSVARAREASEHLTEDVRLLRQRHTVLFVLLAHTGARISEALGLNVGHVLFGAKPTLHVRQQFYRGTLSKLKTRNGKRDLPLSPEMARALWPLCGGRSADEPLFASMAGTRLWERNVRRDALDPTAEKAGVDWIGFHTFRHTCASLLFEDGRNIKQVSRWLGHADPAFTLRTYVHLMDEGIGGADFLDSVVPPSGNGLAAKPLQDTAGKGSSIVNEIAV